MWEHSEHLLGTWLSAVRRTAAGERHRGVVLLVLVGDQEHGSEALRSHLLLLLR